MSLTLLQQIRASNKSFLAGASRPPDISGGPFFVVITCIDPRLTDLLGPAMGLPKNRASIIRVAGNRIDRSSHDVMRSVAAAIYLNGCEEILVVGHTDCALLTFSAPKVIERFRSAGIPRDAFGGSDLREWFGAFPDVRSNVADAVASLRNSGLLSAKAKIHGVIIDTSSGELTVVHDGDSQLSLVAPDVSSEDAAQGLAPTKSPSGTGFPTPPVQHVEPPAAPVPPVKTLRGPIVIPSVASVGSTSGAPPESMTEAAAILGEFFVRESQNPRCHSEIVGFRNLLRVERNPERILSALEKLVREHVSHYPRLPGAVEYLTRQAGARNLAGGRALEMLHLILDNM